MLLDAPFSVEVAGAGAMAVGLARVRVVGADEFVGVDTAVGALLVRGLRAMPWEEGDGDWGRHWTATDKLGSFPWLCSAQTVFWWEFLLFTNVYFSRKRLDRVMSQRRKAK